MNIFYKILFQTKICFRMVFIVFYKPFKIPMYKPYIANDGDQKLHQQITGQPLSFVVPLNCN